MATPLNTRLSHNARSISLPSRSHPIAAQFDEHLSRLRSSQSASTSSSISHKLSNLKDTYNSVEELLLLPLNQQTLAQAKWVNDILDGSLRLLDICGMARDVLLQSKQSVQDIQSVLRRRCSGELSIATEVNEYMNARKRAKKTVKKSLKEVKCLLHRCIAKNDEQSAVLSMLRDLERVTAEIFELLLSYMGGPNKESRKITWALIPRMMHQKVASGNEEAALKNEFEDVDVAFSSVVSQKSKAGINTGQVEKMHIQMMKLECVIQDFDEVLECLYRSQVKTRATLLNILSN